MEVRGNWPEPPALLTAGQRGGRVTMRLLCVVCLLCLPVAQGGGAIADINRMPPGSFLTTPVGSGEDLGNRLLADRATADRFARHFGMDPGELAAYFHNNVHSSALSKGGTYTVYYMLTSGKIVSRTKRLAAGTRVFVDFNGRPVLEVACGNPMTRVLFTPPMVLKPNPVSSPIQVAEVVPVLPQSSSNPGVIFLAKNVSPQQPLMEVLPNIAVLAPQVILPALLGATAVHGSKVVPEPGTLMVLAAGLGSLALSRRRSQKVH